MNKSVEVQVTALKRYVKCEISSINSKTESLFERLYKMSNTENKALVILQESISFLQKELKFKDKIIKTLIETQKSKNESNELVNQLELASQSRNKMNSSKSPSSLQLLNGKPNY